MSSVRVRAHRRRRVASASAFDFAGYVLALIERDRLRARITEAEGSGAVDLALRLRRELLADLIDDLLEPDLRCGLAAFAAAVDSETLEILYAKLNIYGRAR